MWASEFDKMDLGHFSHIDNEHTSGLDFVGETSNSTKLKKKGQKEQQESQKLLSPHARGGAKENREAPRSCCEKTKPVAFVEQTHSFRSLGIPTPCGPGNNKITTNHAKAIGSQETLRTPQVVNGYPFCVLGFGANVLFFVIQILDPCSFVVDCMKLVLIYGANSKG